MSERARLFQATATRTADAATPAQRFQRHSTTKAQRHEGTHVRWRRDFAAGLLCTAIQEKKVFPSCVCAFVVRFFLTRAATAWSYRKGVNLSVRRRSARVRDRIGGREKR